MIVLSSENPLQLEATISLAIWSLQKPFVSNTIQLLLNLEQLPQPTTLHVKEVSGLTLSKNPERG